jgi:hypothetical protein
MRKLACALLVLGLAACAGQGGDEAAETADTPSMTAAPSDTAGMPCVGDTCPAPMVRDTSVPCDTCQGRD